MGRGGLLVSDSKHNMKKLFSLILVAAAFALVAPNQASAAGGKTITIKGKGMCAKCCLKEGEKCRNVVQVTRKGKKINYYLADNDVAKDFHGNICKKVQPVEVKGVCKKVGDELVVTAESAKVAPAKKGGKKGKGKKKSS